MLVSWHACTLFPYSCLAHVCAHFGNIPLPQRSPHYSEEEEEDMLWKLFPREVASAVRLSKSKRPDRAWQRSCLFSRCYSTYWGDAWPIQWVADFNLNQIYWGSTQPPPPPTLFPPLFQVPTFPLPHCRFHSGNDSLKTKLKLPNKPTFWVCRHKHQHQDPIDL